MFGPPSSAATTYAESLLLAHQPVWPQKMGLSVSTPSRPNTWTDSCSALEEKQPFHTFRTYL